MSDNMVSVPVDMTGHCGACGSNIAVTLTHTLPNVPGSPAICKVSAGCGKCGATVQLSGTAQL